MRGEIKMHVYRKKKQIQEFFLGNLEKEEAGRSEGRCQRLEKKGKKKEGRQDGEVAREEGRKGKNKGKRVMGGWKEGKRGKNDERERE